ncbi:MAG: DUF2993 domain-containing protein, partial [Cyanothece sp. SIO2G6]|nr:DUF2993 domain-containing protein [Cyanothece sp. SIO2G6]
GVEFPFALIESTLTGLSQQYSLTTLEPQGITARILRLQITDEQLTLTSFVRIAPQP